MAVSKRLRFEVMRRDGHACYYCGRKPPEVTLTIDHVVPETLGGSDDPSNLVTACPDCNGGKSSVPADAALVENVADDAVRWAKALEQAVEIDRAKRTSDKDFVSEVINAETKRGSLMFTMADKNYASTIIRFRDLGLDMDDMRHAMDQMLGRSLFGMGRWKYFCGVCWSMIRDRQAIAQSLLESEGGDECRG
jgi:hypothetical protein